MSEADGGPAFGGDGAGAWGQTPYKSPGTLIVVSRGPWQGLDNKRWGVPAGLVGTSGLSPAPVVPLTGLVIGEVRRTAPMMAAAMSNAKQYGYATAYYEAPQTVELTAVMKAAARVARGDSLWIGTSAERYRVTEATEVWTEGEWCQVSISAVGGAGQAFADAEPDIAGVG